MNRRLFCQLVPVTTLALAILSPHADAAEKAASPAPTQFRAYVGTYTGKKSQGIYTFTFNAATGETGKPELAGEAVNPSFLAIHPDGKHLYAIGEVAEVAGKKGGGVSAFAIQSDGKLQLLNQASTVGSGPAHLSLDKSGRVALAANYGGGSVVALPIKADGSVGDHTVADSRNQGGNRCRDRDTCTRCDDPGPGDGSQDGDGCRSGITSSGHHDAPGNCNRDHHS